jgi:hypothetical protein
LGEINKAAEHADGGHLQHHQHRLHQTNESHARPKLVVLWVLGITLPIIVALHILIVIVPYSFGLESRDLPPELGNITGSLWVLLIGWGLPVAPLVTVGVYISLAWSWPHVTRVERRA